MSRLHVGPPLTGRTTTASPVGPGEWSKTGASMPHPPVMDSSHQDMEGRLSELERTKTCAGGRTVSAWRNLGSPPPTVWTLKPFKTGRRMERETDRWIGAQTFRSVCCVPVQDILRQWANQLRGKMTHIKRLPLKFTTKVALKPNKIKKHQTEGKLQQIWNFYFSFQMLSLCF